MKPVSTALLGLFVAVSLYGGRAEATCEFDVLSGTTQMGGTTSLIDVVVDASLPNGSVFRKIDAGFGNGSPQFKCTQDHLVDIRSYVVVGGVESGDVIRELLLQDGTPTGVGLRFAFTDADGVSHPVPSPRPRQVWLRASTDWQPWTSETHVEYIKLRDDIRYGQIQANDRLAQTDLETQGIISNTTFNKIRRIRTGMLRLVSPACSIDAGDLTQEVKLGHYGVDDFRNQAESPWVPFYFTVTSCANPLERLADITFGGGGDTDPNNNALFSMNPGGPGGLGIAIQTDDGTNAAMTPGATRAFADPVADKRYAFRALLERTVGDVTPGTINRQVTVRVNFR